MHLMLGRKHQEWAKSATKAPKYRENLPLRFCLPCESTFFGSSLEDTPPLPNNLGPDESPAPFFSNSPCRRVLGQNHFLVFLVFLVFCALRFAHHSSPLRRQRLTMAKSTERTRRPSGTIQIPNTGKNAKNPPIMRIRPKKTLAILEAGTGTV